MNSKTSVFTSLYHAGDTPSDYIRRGEFYEEDIFKKFKPLIPDQGTFLDIGANIGNHSVMFNYYYPSRPIFSVEGNPFNYSKLATNVMTINNITPISCCVSEETELVEFVHFAPSPGCSRLAKYYGDVEGDDLMCGTHINTCPKVYTISHPLDLFNFEDISFIKIDVENHELSVFKGAYNLIKTCKPIIWVEDFIYSKDRENSGTQFLINEFGYEIAMQDIDDNYLLICKK